MKVILALCVASGGAIDELLEAVDEFIRAHGFGESRVGVCAVGR
jgi:hypothetical protein